MLQVYFGHKFLYYKLHLLREENVFFQKTGADMCSLILTFPLIPLIIVFYISVESNYEGVTYTIVDLLLALVTLMKSITVMINILALTMKN
jgi:hypothetical protein